jgi:hypothetical protein
MVTGQGAFPPKRTFKRLQHGLTPGLGVCYTQIAHIALTTAAASDEIGFAARHRRGLACLD